MKLEEVVEYMSKLYLERAIKSFTTNYPSNNDEAHYREIIKENVVELSDAEKIEIKINNYLAAQHHDPYANKLLYYFILKVLLSASEFQCTEDEICNSVEILENEIVEKSKSTDSFKHIDTHSEEIFSVVLDTALEDEIISDDELSLLVRIREKLNISEKDQYLIQAKLDQFPTSGNKTHTREEIVKGIEDLQKCGVVFYCNKFDEISGKVLLIPVELVDGIKSFMNIQLIEDKYLLLLENFTNQQLREVLSSKKIHKSGTKDELIERIIHSGIKPKESLKIQTTNDLGLICEKIPSLKKSGSKSEKIDRLINYYSKLIIKGETEENSGERYFEYLEELAKRDIDNLLGNNVVKDHDYIDKAFEEGTTFLFNNRLNIKTLDFEGNEHADGCAYFGNEQSVLLWDNKSKKEGEPYTFPDKHFRQFRRYIRNEREGGRRVNSFLIITAEIDPGAEKNAYKLKAESGVDTDVAIITAENLKYVAENWTKYTNAESFNLQILNRTGILDIDTLKKQMKYLS